MTSSFAYHDRHESFNESCNECARSQAPEPECMKPEKPPMMYSEVDNGSM